MPDKPTDVPAIARVHDILEALKTSRRPTSAKDLLALTGMPRSTLYLTLEALERRQWLVKIGDGYAIGVALFEIGSTYLLADFTLDAFRREAAWFVAKHNEAVQMAVLDRAEVVYLAREDPSRAVRLVSDIGSRLPAHCSALGKALLASLDDETVQMIMPARLRALTEHSLTRAAPTCWPRWPRCANAPTRSSARRPARGWPAWPCSWGCPRRASGSPSAPACRSTGSRRSARRGCWST